MTLNIDTFNDIILQAAKDDKAKLEILEAELAMVADLFYNEVASFLDELLESGYTSERFTRIQNIKNNSETLLERVEKLRAEAGDDI